MMTRPRVIHPYLLAAFPICYLYSHNFRTVDGVEVWIPLGLSVAASAVAYATLRLARLDGPRAGLIISASLVLFFTFHHGIRVCERVQVGQDRSSRERIVLTVDAALLAMFIGMLFRRPGLARPLDVAANAASIVLTAWSSGGMLLSNWTDRIPISTESAGPIAWHGLPTPGRPPDVYLVILDAYGRSDVLREMHGYDNSATLARLERRGFVVAGASESNYCQTTLSLAATLNLRYLDDLAGDATHDRRPLRRMIADNRLFRTFRDHGYRMVTFASGFDATESFEVDLTLAPPGHLRTFEALVVDQTPLWLLLGQRTSREPHRLHRERALKVFDELPSRSHPSDAPTFTFAHVVSPHPPFVFGADGEDVSGRERTYSLSDSEGWCGIPGHEGPEDYSRRYRDQVAYVTGRVEAAVDRILDTSSTPPIILLMGDHGPGSRFDSGADRPNDVRERFGILNACYLPERARGRITHAITPVNTIRAVLDECFGSRLGPLDDRSFYSSYARPYIFTEVTADLD